ncbi:MAG: hypothetical protein H6835_03780 [Planctomycetes bacterium]|nr:hypothetical protein [Planctomycetota bacterium]
MQTWLLAAALVAAVAAAAAAQAADPPPARGRLHAVRIVANDVFESDTHKFLEQMVNALHWKTREEVIRRELWFGPGDMVDAAMAAEFERNLRALGLFGEARAELVPVGEDGGYDLVVRTRDRLTLNVNASVSYVGGKSGLRGALGDRNVLGYGNRLAASYAENSDDEYRGSVSYSDLHMLDSWHTASITMSRTDEGDALGVGVRRPFKHLLDPRAYGVDWNYAETEVDYYRDDEVVATIPDTSNVLGADITWAAGPRERRRRLGLLLRIEAHDYEPATGTLASLFRVPGDTQSVFLGPTIGWREIAGFRKVDNLDTLRYVQDVALGTEFTITAGARWRDEHGVGGELQPELSALATWTAEPFADLYANLTGSAGWRWYSGDTVGWRTSLGARAYYRFGRDHTLCVNVAFDAVEEAQDLPIELTLGDANGLRGYPVRQLVGTRRVVGNLEHRVDTTLDVLTLRLGVATFFDLGQVGDGRQLGRAFTSAGCGLRVGSRRLLGRNVLRIDLAKPLDELQGADQGWQLSVSIGQAFTFDGGTTEHLPR